MHQRFHAPSLYAGPPGWKALDDGCELWFGWHRSCGLDGTGAVQGAAKPSSESCRWWRLALSFCRDVEMRWEKQRYSAALQMQGCFLPASSNTACRRERAGGIHRCEDGRRVSLMGAGIQGSDLYVRSQDVSHQHLFFGGERA